LYSLNIARYHILIQME